MLTAPKKPILTEDGIDRSIYEEDEVNGRGFYTEGAYIGAPDSNLSADTDADETTSTPPQAVYFRSLLDRFDKLHEQLDSKPPASIVDHLDEDHRYYMSSSRDDNRKWRWRLFNTDPLPAQLASMDKTTVFKLLRLILNSNGFLGSKPKITHRLSRWIWGLLAKVPVRGELMSEEIGLIRDIGKRAVWLGVEMRGVDIKQLYAASNDDEEEVVIEYEVANTEDGAISSSVTAGPIIGPIMPTGEEAVTETQATAASVEPVDTVEPQEAMLSEGLHAMKESLPNDVNMDDLDESHLEGSPDENIQVEAMKARLLASLDDNDTEQGGAAAELLARQKEEAAALELAALEADNAKITVDMIITIAGEVYGQRDLLEFREEW